MKTHADVINLFSSASDLADKIGEKHNTVRVWRHRNKIPSRAWLPIVNEASRIGKKVTLEFLAKAQAKS